MTIRSPIVTVLGHVDHGKSSILDAIRGSNIVKGEAGAITQAIGASIIPINTIRKKTGKLLESLNMNFTIPGLLFIDTPGHAAFTSLRSRGGNLADIAIVVVDINEGCKPQTLEAIEILKNAKTPFIIAANKIDLISGFSGNEKEPLIEQINSLQPHIITKIDTKMYELVGELHSKFGLSSERFDRVEDYTKQIAIIPCSAKTKFGLQELLMVLTGLAQKFLEKNLNIDTTGPAKGIILEVKEDKGMGKTLDVILYDGTLKAKEKICFGTLTEPKITKIRALFTPEENTEMRDKKGKFKSVKEISAASGVKISAPDLEGAMSGMPIITIDKTKTEEEAKEEVAKELQSVQIDTEEEGVIIKADTLGSLEAMIQLLKEKKIPIRKANVGNISKKDIIDAKTNKEKNPLYAVILGFNIEQTESTDEVKIIVEEVIYSLLDKLEKWQEEVKNKLEAKQLEGVTRPSKIEILQNSVFRQSNPCIMGIEVIKGTLQNNIGLMKENGKSIGVLKGIQADNKAVIKAEKGRQVAISIPNITFNRTLEEMEFLYSEISEEDFIKLKKYVKHLTGDEVETLKKIAQIKRENNPVWGV